jgi:hypothetical protein
MAYFKSIKYDFIYYYFNVISIFYFYNNYIIEFEAIKLKLPSIVFFYKSIILINTAQSGQKSFNVLFAILI